MILQITEMLLFMCILSVFMVGYGIASQALLYPNQEFSFAAIKSILYMPYFQIYGELFLEVVVEGKAGWIFVHLEQKHEYVVKFYCCETED